MFFSRYQKWDVVTRKSISDPEMASRIKDCFRLQENLVWAINKRSNINLESKYALVLSAVNLLQNILDYWRTNKNKFVGGFVQILFTIFLKLNMSLCLLLKPYYYHWHGLISTYLQIIYNCCVTLHMNTNNNVGRWGTQRTADSYAKILKFIIKIRLVSLQSYFCTFCNGLVTLWSLFFQFSAFL